MGGRIRAPEDGNQTEGNLSRHGGTSKVESNQRFVLIIGSAP
jgi:hypothetical protein